MRRVVVKYARALEVPLYRLFYEGKQLRNSHDCRERAKQNGAQAAKKQLSCTNLPDYSRA